LFLSGVLSSGIYSGFSFINEYNIISLSPFSASYDRTLIPGYGIADALGVIDDDTLIIGRNISFNSAAIVELDISNPTPTDSIIFTLPDYEAPFGDIFVTTTDRLIFTTVSGSTYYLLQYSGYSTVPTLELRINLSSSGLTQPVGLFESGGNIFIMDASTIVYQININSPYNITSTGFTFPINPRGASNVPSCLTVHFIV